jgi:hypothetical protein
MIITLLQFLQHIVIWICSWTTGWTRMTFFMFRVSSSFYQKLCLACFCVFVFFTKVLFYRLWVQLLLPTPNLKQHHRNKSTFLCALMNMISDLLRFLSTLPFQMQCEFWNHLSSVLHCFEVLFWFSGQHTLHCNYLLCRLFLLQQIPNILSMVLQASK